MHLHEFYFMTLNFIDFDLRNLFLNPAELTKKSLVINIFTVSAKLVSNIDRNKS